MCLRDVATGRPDPQAARPLESDRLRRVRSQHDADQLWQEIAATGTPLVEDDGHLVTFLWRDDGATDHVLVVGGPATWDPIETDLMERLPGTDVWFRSYRVEPGLVATYWLSPNDSLQPSEQVLDWVARERTFQADPLNPHRLRWPANPADPSTPAHERSVLVPGELPQAPPVRLDEHVVPSTALDNQRRVWVHRTPGAGAPRILVLLDGWVWARALPVASLLDGVSDRTGPLVVAMVDALDEETRDRELECHPSFVRFLTDELVPFLRETYDARGRIAVAGQSLGGLTAVFAALTAPEVVAVAGAQSGSFWWPRDEADRAQEAVRAMVRERPVADVAVHLETGSLEGSDMVDTARRLHEALAARGYPVEHQERHGGHDWLRWQLDLPDLVERMLS